MASYPTGQSEIPPIMYSEYQALKDHEKKLDGHGGKQGQDEEKPSGPTGKSEIPPFVYPKYQAMKDHEEKRDGQGHEMDHDEAKILREELAILKKTYDDHIVGMELCKTKAIALSSRIESYIESQKSLVVGEHASFLSQMLHNS